MHQIAHLWTSMSLTMTYSVELFHPMVIVSMHPIWELPLSPKSCEVDKPNSPKWRHLHLRCLNWAEPRNLCMYILLPSWASDSIIHASNGSSHSILKYAIGNSRWIQPFHDIRRGWQQLVAIHHDAVCSAWPSELWPVASTIKHTASFRLAPRLAPNWKSH